MRFNNTTLFDATTMGGTTVVYSPTIPLWNVYSFAFQYTRAGSAAAGSLQLQASCDQGLDELGTGVTNWADIDSAITLSTIGTTIVNKDATAYKWIRMKYTPNSGTGTLTVTLNTKGA